MIRLIKIGHYIHFASIIVFVTLAGEYWKTHPAIVLNLLSVYFVLGHGMYGALGLKYGTEFFSIKGGSMEKDSTGEVIKKFKREMIELIICSVVLFLFTLTF